MEDNTPNIHHSFYKNIWFWLFLLTFVAGIIVLYNIRVKNHIAETPPAVVSVQNTEKAEKQTQVSIQKDSQQKQKIEKSENIDLDGVNAKVDNLLASGKLVNGLSNKIYGVHQPVLIKRDLIVSLDGYRTEFDQYPYRSYLVVDFEIINISNEEYHSSPLNLNLRDMNKLNYTYAPTYGAHITGSIEGIIKYKDSKRGEVAFNIPILGNPIKNPLYNLEFSTETDSPGIVSFSIDLNKADQYLGQ